MKRVIHTIDTDTPILPLIVAETVMEEKGLSREHPLTARLAEHAEYLYKLSKPFHRKINGSGNSGRDYLYMKMRQWRNKWLVRDRKDGTTLKGLVAAGRAALNGDSSDAEHDALYQLVEYLE